MTRPLVLFLSLALVVLAGQTSSAQEDGIEATGEAPIVGADRVRARERALDEALRQAVEQALSLAMEPEAWNERAPKLRLQLADRVRDHVPSYRVLEEGEQGNVFRLRIIAQVVLGSLGADLDGAVGASPRLVLCPTVNGPAPLAAELEPRLRHILGGLGVDVSCQPQTTGQERRLSLIVEAASQASGWVRGTSLAIARVTLALRLLEGGEVRGQASAEAEASQATLDAAVAMAAASALSRALARLDPAWEMLSRSDGGSWRIHLRGVVCYAELLALQRSLGAVPGVVEVGLRRLAEEGIDLDVRAGNPRLDLAAALSRLSLETAQLIVEPLGPRDFAIRLVSLPPPPASEMP